MAPASKKLHKVYRSRLGEGSQFFESPGYPLLPTKNASGERLRLGMEGGLSVNVPRSIPARRFCRHPLLSLVLGVSAFPKSTNRYAFSFSSRLLQTQVFPPKAKKSRIVCAKHTTRRYKKCYIKKLLFLHSSLYIIYSTFCCVFQCCSYFAHCTFEGGRSFVVASHFCE